MIRNACIEMKTTLLILKIIVLCLIGLGALALFWVYLIPGIVLGLLHLDRRHKWLPCVTALLIPNQPDASRRIPLRSPRLRVSIHPISSF